MAKVPWLFGAVFGTVGIGLLVVALVTLQTTRAFRREALRAEGTVIAIESGKPVVEFVDRDGRAQRVVGGVSSDPPAYEVGERTMVRYRLGQPEHARIDGFLESWFVPMLFGGLGGIFALIGGGFLVSGLRRRRLRSWLQQFGMRVEAKYTGTRLDSSVRISGRHPWRITAQWQNPATGLVHTFESELLGYDPSEFVRSETVAVWIDADDPERHYVDTTFLPKHAGA